LSHPVFDGADIEQVSGPGDSAPTEHGTYTASLLFAQPNSRLLGVAPACQGIIIPILDQSLRCSQDVLAKGIEIALELGAQVINVSAGASSLSGRASPVLESAVRASERAGALVVAAAGNDGCPCLHVPGALSATLVVGAMGRTGEPLPMSNWGREYQETGILSPGEKIPGASLTKDLIELSGTSSASAITAGVIALLLGLSRNRDTKIPREISDTLLRTASGCDAMPVDDCRKLLRGRMDLNAALTELIIERGPENMSEQETVESSGMPIEGDTLPPQFEEKKDVDDEGIPQKYALAQASSAGSPGRTLKRESDLSKENAAEVRPTSGCTCTPGPNGECTCGASSSISSLVYAIGQLDVDFVSDARYASLTQRMGKEPTDLAALIKHLRDNPSDAASLYWTVKIEEAPMYVIAPVGAFAENTYATLTSLLEDTIKDASRISVAGVAKEVVRLRSGISARALVVDPRGFASWTTTALVKASNPKGDAARSDAIKNFLERVYYELRNLGMAPEDRALNYAATNAFNATKVLEDALGRNLELDDIQVERAPVARPNADAWDVKLSFFDPENVNRARRVYRYTVDVADTLPVTIGDIRSWAEH